MGDYAKSLTLGEYEAFKKAFKIFMVVHDIEIKDIAVCIGYSPASVYGAMADYKRCGRFLTAALMEYMEEYEKDN